MTGAIAAASAQLGFHVSQLIEIQTGCAAKMILASMADNELYYGDGTLQEFIEAANASAPKRKHFKHPSHA